MRVILPFIVLHFVGLAIAQNNVGPGNCLDFSANINNSNHINLGALSWLNTNDFTVECWMKVNAVFDDEAFFSNKNWASGSNTGLVFDVQDNGANMKFNFKDPSNPRVDLTVAVDVLNRDWFHFAGTFKRGGYFVVYINGVAKDSLNVSSITGSFASQYTYKLGQDGTGNYTWNGANPRYNGKIDDFRIWSLVRTPQQIRANMCHSLAGTEPNLYAYYTCNESYNGSLNDLTANNNDGQWVNGVNANSTLSGAPLGIASVQKYGASLTSDSLFISSASGEFKVKNFNGITGIHVYHVDNAPTLSGGLSNLPGNTNYYGVFICDTSDNVSFTQKYDYTGFAAAINDENNLVLFNRTKNDVQPWANGLPIQNIALNQMTKLNVKTRREYILGSSSGLPCQSTDSIYLVNATTTSANVGWQSAGNHWNILWGTQGFNLNNGTLISNTTSNPYNFTNLSSGVIYEMYVQDTCQGSGAGIWIGPFSFTGQACLNPSQLGAINITGSSATLTWTNNTPSASVFDIQWGLPGFTLGTGIPANGVQLPYILTGLGPNTSYSYYVRTVCGQNNTSGWEGPYVFTTSDNAGILEASAGLSIYPNPFVNSFTLVYVGEKPQSILLRNVLGQAVDFTVDYSINGLATLALVSSEPGIYFMEFMHQGLKQVVTLMHQ
jgi:hypothetical protein